jgi:hypothetical protein
VSVKTEVLIRAPVSHILSIIKEHQWSSHGNPQNLGVEPISNIGHYYGNRSSNYSDLQNTESW